MKNIEESTSNDHIYENGSWSKYLDTSLPKLFESTFKIDTYVNSLDLSSSERKQKLKDEKERVLDVNKEFTETFVNLKKTQEINGWSYTSTEKIRNWNSSLAFNWLINYHYMYKLKKRESHWSWYLIVISTICSTLTVIDSSNLFLTNIVKYIVTFFAIITSLIAAYMKKENFVERIKEMDRYIQKVGHIHIEIENILQCKPWNRIPYREFYEKHYTDIVQLFSAAPPMSPEEFKITVYNLTVYNPELLYDADPWFQLKKIGDIEYYHMTDFGKEVIEGHNNTLSMFKYIFCCLVSKCCDSGRKSKFIDSKAFNEKTINEIINEKIKENNTQLKLLQEDKKFKDRVKDFHKTNESNKEIDLDV